MTPFPHRSAAVFAAALALAGCRSKIIVDDPLDGAIHLPEIGKTEPYGQATDLEPTVSAEDTEVERLAGPRGTDLKVVRRVLTERWANRERHETLDGVDVPATVRELAEKSGKAKGDTEFAKALREATCQLADGHLRIVDGAETKAWSSGVAVVPASGEFVVADVDPGHFSASDRKPKLGDVIEKVDGTAVRTFAETTCLSPGSTAQQREHLAARSLGHQTRFGDEKPAPTKLTVRRGKSKSYTIKLPWRAAKAAESGPCVDGKMIGSEHGLLTIHTFACRPPGGADGEAAFARQLDDAISNVSTAEHLVVDLRHNGGGSDTSARAAARLLVSGNPAWMRYRHIDDRDAGFADDKLEGDGAAAYDGPLSVLVGPGCASTCEIFASVLSQRPDTTMIGQATAGSVGNPEGVELPTSKIVLWVPKTQYAIPGTDALIEGRGVQPQVEVLTTSADVRRKRDPVLENALQR